MKNNDCLEHIFFIEKDESCEYEFNKGTCLRCGLSSLWLSNIKDANNIYQEELQKIHKINYDYNTIKMMIDEILVLYPNLTQEELINKLKVELLNIDLITYLLSHRKSINPLIKLYYKTRINVVEKQISNIENTGYTKKKTI